MISSWSTKCCWCIYTRTQHEYEKRDVFLVWSFKRFWLVWCDVPSVTGPPDALLSFHSLISDVIFLHWWISHLVLGWNFLSSARVFPEWIKDSSLCVHSSDIYTLIAVNLLTESTVEDLRFGRLWNQMRGKWNVTVMENKTSAETENGFIRV